MFDARELQILISGAPTPIDIEDLKKHTNYAGGYHKDHNVILIFWKVVEQFDEQEKRKLLKFVTSCSRPPLLGFKDLYPGFCIQKAGDEPNRLPTASTCMNLLKLPEFKDLQTMNQKLRYAVDSGSGFELS
jgi:ubiquitin-protein ligase E3 C